MASLADLDAAFAPAPRAPVAPAATLGDLDAAFAPTTAPTPPRAPVAPPAPAAAPFDLTSLAGPDPTQIDAAILKQQADDAAAARKMLAGADLTTGVPTSLRMEVAAAPTPADRLAAIRKWYPDAEPVPGSSNFVFTNPATGRKTSMMQTGLPWYEPSAGGMWALGDDAAALLGGLAAGAGGAAAGTFLAPGVGTVAGELGGFGLGSAAGRELYRRGLGLFGYDITDTRTPAEIAADMAKETALNAATAGAGKLVAPIVADVLRPGIGTATQQAARNLDATGVTDNLAGKLPAAVATQSPTEAMAEGATFRLPGGGAVRNAYVETDKALTEGAQNVAQQASGRTLAPTPTTFAGRVGDIAKDMDTKFDALRTNLEAQATNLIGKTTPVDITPFRTMRQGMLDAIDRGAPRSDYADALDRLNQIIDAADAQPSGALSFDVMQKWRTNVGKDAGFEGRPNADIPATGIPAMQQLYAGLKGVLGNTAQAAGPNAEAAWNLYNGTVAAYRANLSDTLTDLMDPALRSDRLTKLTQSTAPQDQNAIASLFASPYLSPGQRGELVGGFVNQLGTTGAKGAENFDMPTWLKNYNNMTSTAKATIFGNPGGQVRDALDQLATVQRQIQQSAIYRNTSNTAYTGLWAAAMMEAARALAMGGYREAAAVLGGAAFPGMVAR